MAEETGNSGQVGIKIEIKEEPVFLETSTIESEVLDHTNDPLKEEIKDEEKVDVHLLKDEVIVGEPSVSAEEASRLMQNLGSSTSSGDESLKRNVDILKHLKNDETEEGVFRKVYVCNICRTEFMSKADFKEHISLHYRDKGHVCIICEKNFSARHSLKRHMLTHTRVKSHKCEVCGRIYSRKYNLSAHKLKHTNPKQYQCKSCNKVLTNIYDLRRHMTIHDRMEPHKCETCGKGFTNIYLLNVHRLSHTRLGPYMCESCGVIFDSKHSVKSHFLQHVEDNTG